MNFTLNGIIATVASIALGVVLIGVLFWAITSSNESNARWAQWCADQGGHVDTAYSTGVGYAFGNGKSGSGGVVVTSSSTTYCIGPNGIVGVR